MLLGIYLHAALPHRPDAGLTWAFRDPSTSAWMAASIEVIHAFRMQLFFLLAGFFTALLIQRRGWRAMLKNRALRIGLPYMVGIVVISPICAAAWMWAASDWGYVSLRVLAGEIGGSWHLWFLRELLIFCAAAALIAAIVPAHLLGVCAAVAGRAGLHWSGPLILALLVLLSVLAQPWWGIYEPGVLPRWENLVHYGLFFAVGAALWPSRHRLAILGGRWFYWSAVGAAAAAAHYAIRHWFMDHGGFDLQWIGAEPLGASLLARLAYALMSASLVAAFLGLFLWAFARPSVLWRTISDASYWMYLIHFPLVLVVGRSVAPLNVPAELKVAVVIVASGALLFGSYALLVRSTIIGRVLNGPGPGRRSPPGIAAGP
jgi:glucans biosynthesis protein C